MIAATGSRRTLQESTGNCWNMEAVFRLENYSDFFWWIPTNFLCFPARTGRKSFEKIRKISVRITVSTKSPELHGTGRFRAGLFDLARKPRIFPKILSVGSLSNNKIVSHSY
jgi:hypothetical protein